MNEQGLYLDPKSMRDLSVNFKAFSREVLAASVEGLKDFGQRIVAQAQEFLDHGGQRASSKLIGSGRAVVQPDNTVDAGFYTMYAEYVEFGRRKGGQPPVDVIEQWLLRKSKRKEKEGKSALRSAAVFTGKSVTELAHKEAWRIARSIALYGTEAHPFLKPAYEKYRIKIGEFMQQKINECCDKYKAKE